MSSNIKKRRLNSESEGSTDTHQEPPALPLSAPLATPKKETPAASQSSAGSDHKPVFGASSTFGKASIFDNIKSGKNVFDSPLKNLQPDTSGAVPATPTTSFGSFGGLFGANTKFSNAFQKASQKKSFLDEPEVSKGHPESPAAAAPTQQYKQVDLTAKEVKTGEENEQFIFSATAKLFELSFDRISDGWKERGVGPLHLNKSIEDPSNIRIVMRSHGLLRVILNYKITSSTNLIKGLESSLSPGKFLRINSVSSAGTPVQYMLKFSDQAVRDELCEKVASLQSGVETTPSATVDETKSQAKVSNSDPAEPTTDVDSEPEDDDAEDDDAEDDEDDEDDDDQDEDKEKRDGAVQDEANKEGATGK